MNLGFAEEYNYNEEPKNRRITRVRRGDVISVQEKEERNEKPVTKKYKIIYAYKYIVVGVCNGVKRCFNVGDLVMLGIEPEKISVI